METLKNVITNVWQIATLASITIRPYILTGPPQLELFSTIEALRKAGKLCWLDHEALLVFGLETEPEEQDLQAPGIFALDKLSWDQIQGLDEQGKLLDKLGAAIAVQISPELLREHQLHLIGKTTWAHQASQDGLQELTLFQMHLRAAKGTLHLVLTNKAAPGDLSRSELRPLSKQVTLAPTGMTGNVLCRYYSSGQVDIYTPISHPREPPADTWKLVVLTMLRSYDITTESIHDWSLVQSGETQLWWPSRMCFDLYESPNTPALTDDTTVSPIDHPDTIDTLSFAETWLMSSEQRKAELESERLHRVQPDMDEHIDLAQSQFDLATAVSPPYVNRPDLINSLNVYPTPPDGMNVAALPRSTATDSTLQVAASANDHDVNALFRTQTKDDDMLLDTRERGPSIASSVGQPFRQSMNDLFGEADAELGTGEIGDHDFDFFDEQDDIVMEDHVGPTILKSPSAIELEPESLPEPELPAVSQHSATSPMQTAAEDHIDTALDSSAIPGRLSPVKQHPVVDSYKPLSPFDIRERLLPPPIPASLATHGLTTSSKRRSSTFEPFIFNTSHQTQQRISSSDVASTSNRTYALSPTTLYHEDSESHDSTSDTMSDEDEASRPTSLPWQKHHGQRYSGNASDRLVSWKVTEKPSPQESISTMILDILQQLLSTSVPDMATLSHYYNHIPDRHDKMTTLLDLLSLDARELVNIVQLCAQQAVSCMNRLIEGQDGSNFSDVPDNAGSALLDVIAAAVSALSPTCTPSEISTIALVKETHRPSLAALKRQSGTGPRTEVSSGPDIQHVPAPYMRFNRADLGLELLPPAIDFWEELNLSPFIGSKDIALFCIGPPGLQDDFSFTTFIESFTAAYEGAKLGSVQLGNVTRPQQSADGVQHFVSLDEMSNGGMKYDPMVYSSACERLAHSLVITPPSRMVVILMIEHPADDSPRSTICASFYAMQQKLKEQSAVTPALHGLKLCLQTMPYTFFEQENLLTVLNSQSMAMLAREVYDRCPATSPKLVGPLPILASPATILANVLPKRIGLQLVPNPSADVSNENSELHVAFSTSGDGQWMTVCWLDSTGWSQQTSVFSLLDQDMLKVIAEILQRTISIMSAKDISWRVVIATDDALSNKQAQLWRHVVAAIQRFRRATTVLLLALDCSPILTLASADSLSSSAAPGGPSAILTPVSTPQGSSFPFSPEASAQGTPSTPNPSETTSELEGEVSLVDYADETWRILLKPELELTSARYADRPERMASAILCKRGQNRGQTLPRLPVIAVDLLWIVRVRAGGGGVEALNVKAAEQMLRDSLATYRGLALLAKVRGLPRVGEECVPLHVLCARRSVKSVEGL